MTVRGIHDQQVGEVL